MRVLSEQTTAALITHDLAYQAVRQALIAAGGDGARTFPTVAAHGADAANVFTIKSASHPEVAGLKIGSYWPGNDRRGLARHGTTIVLLDQDNGHVHAVVEAGRVNAYRTAAADAVAVDVLARPDATTLAIFGAGHQARYEVQAIARVRAITTVQVVARDAERGAAFAAALTADGIPARTSTAESACRAADIVITATPARAPLFDHTWIRPGTHVASMGSDAIGKQELPPELLHRGRLYCDLVSQSVRIGEYQHIADHAAAGRTTITAIGGVLTGQHPGRTNADQITIFDSSGLALQDLYTAQALLAAAGIAEEPARGPYPG